MSNLTKVKINNNREKSLSFFVDKNINRKIGALKVRRIRQNKNLKVNKNYMIH